MPVNWQLPHFFCPEATVTYATSCSEEMFGSSSKDKPQFSVLRPVLSHHALAQKHFPDRKGLKYLDMTAWETLNF